MNPHLSPIEAARQRHRLADVAARTGIWLNSTTGTATVRCPMPSHGHPDRTPSLRLYLDDDTWYCFGCSARAGDVVQWVTQTEGADWRQAIQILDSGQPLTNAWAVASDHPSIHRTGAAGATELPDLERTGPARIREVLDAAWAECTTGPLHARAVAHLARRRIDVTALESYTGRPEAGHTPHYGPTLARRLLSDGFSADQLIDAGLVHHHADGRITDFYTQRLLVPIRDQDGRLAGLVGRNTGDPRWPKYKNPPRTAVYDKSVNLYQPLPAAQHPRGRVIIVEGTLDAMAIAVTAVAAGRPELVCPVTQSGKELSADQMRQVISMHGLPPVLAFDADEAGRDSTRRYRAAARLLGATFDVAMLPKGQDPASWLAEHGTRGLSALLPVPEPASQQGQIPAPLVAGI